MREITDLMAHYRIVARSIWNSGFWCEAELRNWDSRERFEQIKALLFKSLVGARLAAGDHDALASLPDLIYRVVALDPGPVPIMIRQPRGGDRNSYWDDPIREISPSDADLRFVDYFDWNDMNYIDFQYYRVRIVAFPSQPHLVGREALLECRHARVFVA